ncbi:hypothetical protein YYE_00907 [Plasmodium vinckei vinckei]|nr:hypothetical protein YYE_00907 [Plasmodium vinckei vinckei]
MNRYNILYFLNVLGGSVYYFQAIFQRAIEIEMSTNNKAINNNKGYPGQKKTDNNTLYSNLVEGKNDLKVTTCKEPILYNFSDGTPVKGTNNSTKINEYDMTKGRQKIGSISPPNSVEESDDGNIDNVKDVRYYQKLEELNDLKDDITEREADIKEKSEENDDEGEEGDGVMERHSSILIHRGIRSKKLVDYSLYNTYAKSSFLQCAEQADNHFIGNYLGRYNDANFLHLRQKVKLCLCRTFAHIRNTCETCVLHFTHLIFDLYISRFNTKKELIQSIINDIHLNEKQYSDVMIQLLKQHYPTMYQEYLDKEELKQQYIPLYRALFESTDLIYHFIGIICLFISQKYFNYKTTSIIIIAKSYCTSHLEGLKRVYSINDEIIKDVSPDYYSAAKYMGAVFTHGSISKRFALDLEIALLKKLNYDLSIPTAYSLLDSLLKSNKNINFSKLEKNYNLVEGEILLRMAGIDNSFLKYKSSTLSMAIYEILNFNICKDIMQRELSDFTKAKAYNELKEKNERMKKQLFLENEIREELKRKELSIMKRRERGLIIAEEEDRFIVASQYTNEKDNLQIYLKNAIVKICDVVDQKIPTNYYKSHYHITEQIDRYIKDFNKSKKMYLKKLSNRGKGESKKKSVNKIDEITFGNMFNDDEPGYCNNERKEPDNIEVGDKSEYCDENRELESDKEKEREIEQQKKKNEKKAKMFYRAKKKILRIIKKVTKKLKNIQYSDIPIKYCTSYVLHGKDLKVYVKKHKGHYYDKENIMRSENENMKNKEQEKTENNTYGGLSEGSSLKTKKKNEGYIIGSKTESTDENLVFYYNYISRLRNRLIVGLKYFKNRINNIKTTDVSMKLLSLDYILSKKESKKRRNGKSNIRITKHISLYKQLLNEIKILFLWFYKLTNIEIRPLIKFSDLKFISIVKLYDKEYSKYIKNVLNANCANDNESKEIATESNVQTIQDYKGEDNEGQSKDITQKNNIKEKEYKENLDDQKSMSYGDSTGYFKAHDQSISSSVKIKTLQDVYIEEVSKAIETQTKNYDLFLTNDRRMKKDMKNKKRKNKSLDMEEAAKKKERKLEKEKKMAKDMAKKHLEQINSNLEEHILLEKQKYLDYAKTLNFTDGTRIRNIFTDEIIASDQDRNTNADDMLDTEKNVFEREQHMEIEKHQDNSILRLKEDGDFKDGYNSPELAEKNVEKKNKKTIFTQDSLASDDKDWITINDPEVDECAKELMECFLKWKNKNFISKNWTYNEYPKCKEYYFSLVFSDLKSAKSLKGIVEMMHMKYMHLLNIYKEINNQQNLLEED